MDETRNEYKELSENMVQILNILVNEPNESEMSANFTRVVSRISEYAVLSNFS